MLALVMLMVALVSALTAMRLAIHGHEVVVPNLVGMTPVEAEKAATATALQVDIERQYYSPNIPEGRIVSQVPAPGTKVRRGWQVRVAQSLGPQRIAIPDVTGQTPRAAEINIQRRGLDIGATALIRMPNSPADQVLAQTPPPNSSGVSAPRISLLITTAPEPPAYVMPNFVGQPLGSVTTVLQSAGMQLGTVNVTTAGQTSTDQSSPTPAPAPSSLIVSQNPAAGQKITAGTAVNFEVSR